MREFLAAAAARVEAFIDDLRSRGVRAGGRGLGSRARPAIQNCVGRLATACEPHRQRRWTSARPSVVGVVELPPERAPETCTSLSPRPLATLRGTTDALARSNREPVSNVLGRGGVNSRHTGIGMAADLTCPSCGESVLDMGKYTMGRHGVRYERATCPQCRAELVRHPNLEDNTWKVHRPTPIPDQELGGSG